MIQQAQFFVAWMQAKFGVDFTAEKEEGQGLVEYALIIVLVSIACIAALGTLSGGIQSVFGSIAGTLGGA